MLRLPKTVTGAVAGAALFIFGVVSAYPQAAPRSSTPPSAETARQIELLGRIMDILRSDYVDKPDDSKLVTAAINGILGSLDPHSSYMDAKSYRDMQQTTSGQFGGLGMQVNMEDGVLKVVSPIDDTPAARAGILAGDVITKVDDTPTQGLDLNKAVEMMRGAPGTEVRLEITRKDSAPLNLTLTRQIIKVNAVRQEAEGGDVGYVRLNQFTSRAYEDLKQGFQTLATQLPPDRAKGYILDLRNNPGGLLNQAVKVSNTFITDGEIVSTRGRDPDDAQRFDADHSATDPAATGPLIVLVNGGSASASEIVAGALQDHKRATLIGTRSFGKGSVQTIIPLGAGNGALRLTTARYYTPSGRSIQAKGISPDIEVLQEVPDNLKAQTDSKGEASLRGHLKAEGAEETGSQSYVPPNESDDKAIKMALDLLRGTASNAAFPPNPKAAVPN